MVLFWQSVSSAMSPRKSAYKRIAIILQKSSNVSKYSPMICSSTLEGLLGRPRGQLYVLRTIIYQIHFEPRGSGVIKSQVTLR